MAILSILQIDINIVDSNNDTILHKILGRCYKNFGLPQLDNYANTLYILIKYGANYNIQDKYGHSVLDYAYQMDNELGTPFAKLLLSVS